MPQANTNATEARWLPLKTFCERAGITERRARYYVSTGKVRIKPKDKPKERVYIDWLAWNHG
ncbi:hypothetical protein [Hafnia alvei]|uniref:hypothetical protein n=1 Tax=Hafnia alvei TaxID=569 RepID=UPI00103CC389|nr:hypothetical protein [Hafnia alvei]QBJ32304.1 hypothetical protein EYZ02_04950 [Hafnia alvei]